jgi:hypothetical protein
MWLDMLDLLVHRREPGRMVHTGRTNDTKESHVPTVGKTIMAVAMAAVLGMSVASSAVAAKNGPVDCDPATEECNNGQEHHGSGKDRPGYCEPDFCPETTEPEQSHGTALYGEPGDVSDPDNQRRAKPESGDGKGCTATTALNSNPPQAAGDNVAYADDNAEEKPETAQQPPKAPTSPPGGNGGPFYQCE